ncbi:MAG: NAD(P)-dependent alcohol dehydrogenase [Flammeovirgaceae bacterium]|nr:NAD(P)-dependent alcohol dehydrogenase [Flammeovirgaceae bacterium]
MRTIQINRYGKTDRLTIVNVPLPKPPAGYVLIKNSFISINPYDCLARQGKMWFLEGFRFPKILGAESSGVVTEVGAGVTGFETGDRVVVLMGRRGAYSEYVTVPESCIVRIPPEVKLEDAATLPVAGTSAYDAVHQRASVVAGVRVLITGAGGSLGSFAVQFSRLVGAEVTALCRESKIEAVRDLGATEVSDYRKYDLNKSGKTWDVILDCSGVLKFSSARSYLSQHGKMIAVLPGPSAMTQQMISSKAQKKLKVLFGNPTAEKVSRLLALVRNRSLKPLIGKEFPFDSIIEAHQLCESGAAIGKILLRVD